MSTKIYYFSGTGNNLSIARKLAGKIEDSEIVSIPLVIDEKSPISGEKIGIVCPIYMYNMPLIVADFIKKIKEAAYIFFVFAGGGEPGNGIKVTKDLFAAQNLKLSSLFNIPMPDNYTPYGGTPKEKQDEFFKNADKRIDEIAAIVNAGKEHFDVSNTSFFEANIHPGILYKMGYQRINIMDKNFTADEKCDGCSICQKVCPVNNITLEDGKPLWNNRCQQCYACLQWCPQESIQAGKKTVGVKRYHNPDVKVKDIIDSSPQ